MKGKKCPKCGDTMIDDNGDCWFCCTCGYDQKK